MTEIYRHYKGGIYSVIGSGYHTETGQLLVFYEGTDGHLWARPAAMFHGKVEVAGEEVPRFELIGNFRFHK